MTSCSFADAFSPKCSSRTATAPGKMISLSFDASQAPTSQQCGTPGRGAHDPTCRRHNPHQSCHDANTLTSRQSLKKYVRANNTINVGEKMFDSLFNKALKNGVDKGVFEQPKGMQPPAAFTATSMCTDNAQVPPAAPSSPRRPLSPPLLSPLPPRRRLLLRRRARPRRRPRRRSPPPRRLRPRRRLPLRRRPRRRRPLLPRRRRSPPPPRR